MQRFFMFRRNKYMSNSKYLEKSKTLIEVCQATVIEVGEFHTMANDIMEEVGDDPDLAETTMLGAAMTLVTEHYQAVAFLLSSDRSIYGTNARISNGWVPIRCPLHFPNDCARRT